jgi:hypothetical protein
VLATYGNAFHIRNIGHDVPTSLVTTVAPYVRAVTR